VNCPACGTSNEPARKFCRECGAALLLRCPSCGTGNPPGDKFCGECGTALAAAPAPPAAAAPAAPAPAAAAAAERRLVSVLFVDLVGFTTLSERRDPEDVRELLTRYFDTARRLVERYGGVVEKFIGDAVMAVWGTPTAQEDDAERAVRAALDLVDAVAVLGAEVGADELAARAGVLTGGAAVTLGAEGQGMVAGDLVNTAARVQAAAAPGTVLVGEATRRATEAAVVYADAGAHQLKGKAEPVPLWRAVRVVAGRGGTLRAAGLEPPFTGRERELRLVKELFHATAEERRARLVSVEGVGGIGKSRLAWEFEKYIDGLLEGVWWHRGRCLAYGEGVTYWALAEMVRMRAGILEAEPSGTAMAKLAAAVDEHVADPEERRWIQPRLAHLLGLEELAVTERDDLFSAWRRFFECLSQRSVTVLVFEDLQWADAALLDFIDHLLDWSSAHPLYVLVLARPELHDRHPGWAARRRGATSIPLAPLPAPQMEQLLAGLVPGLPDGLRRQILDRAEGVPLYAVETVRMLLDRGLLERHGDRYRVAGAVQDLEVPETLHALIAARLDGLAPEERRLLQDAAVLGKTFTSAALAALGGTSPERLERLLGGLVRKELLSIQADPRSPERGQYGFLQDMVRRVAYETLARRERRARHLAAAAHLETAWGAKEDEIVEVVAAHYLQAWRAGPDTPDAAGIKAKAIELLAGAGRRAASLAAGAEARRYFEQAAELADDPVARAGLLEQAGQMAWMAADGDQAGGLFGQAIELFEAAGLTHPAARVSARLADVDWSAGRLEEGLGRMRAAFEVLTGDEPDADLATLAAQLGRLEVFSGALDDAAGHLELALEVAEALSLPEVLAEALATKASVLHFRGRVNESQGLTARALQIALEHDLASAAVRAYGNLAFVLSSRDRHEAAVEQLERGLAMARKVGSRPWELHLLDALVDTLLMLGRWDEADARAAEIPEPQVASGAAVLASVTSLPEMHVRRGELERAEGLLARGAALRDSGDLQDRAAAWASWAVLLQAQGRHAEALKAAGEALGAREQLGPDAQGVKFGLVAAVEAALALGDLDRAEELLSIVERLRPGQRPPFLDAQASRFRAHLAAGRGRPDQVEPGYKAAAGLLRELGSPFWLGVVLLEHAEWLAAQDRPGEADPLLEEAGAIFERLGARPWTERLHRLAGRPAQARS
jgi:class 3 adenylate cyclase/tetratricopeptide (TPR) repeat protein